MRAARFVVAAFALAAPSGCALFGFDLSDYGGGGATGTDGGGTNDGQPGQDGLAADGADDGAITADGADGGGPIPDAPGPDAPFIDAQRDTGGSDAPIDSPTDTSGSDSPIDSSPPPCNFTTYKRVFVSSKTYTATALASVANADMECDNLAAAAGVIEPFFHAWLSDDTDSAASRMLHNSTDAYVLMDKATVVACTWDELVSVPHRHGIDQDESKNPAPTTPTCGGTNDRAVWTGSTTSGSIAIGMTCGGWTSTAGNGAMGFAHATDAAWTNGCSGAVCGGTGAIYCVEQ